MFSPYSHSNNGTNIIIVTWGAIRLGSVFDLLVLRRGAIRGHKVLLMVESNKYFYGNKNVHSKISHASDTCFFFAKCEFH